MFSTICFEVSWSLCLVLIALVSLFVLYVVYLIYWLFRYCFVVMCLLFCVVLSLLDCLCSMLSLDFVRCLGVV